MDLRDIRLWVAILIIVSLFILTSYYSNKYSDRILDYLGEQSLIKAASIYLFISIVSIIIAPISSLPLLPVIANLWGGLWAGLISILGWTFGNFIAFVLAKKYGRPLVRKIGTEKEISQLREYLPQKGENLFLKLVLLRIVFPIDLLSYVLGLFAPDIKLKTFFWSTLVGMAPGTLLFSYLGTISIIYQLALFVLAFLVFYYGSKYIKHRTRLLHR